MRNEFQSISFDINGSNCLLEPQRLCTFVLIALIVRLQSLEVLFNIVTASACQCQHEQARDAISMQQFT